MENVNSLHIVTKNIKGYKIKTNVMEWNKWQE